jgi:D-alanyl-lipoteichoic acid acyltransferase DltB (MBOAT superfamily)
LSVPSWAFLGFSLAAAILFNLSSAIGWRRGILLATNLAFLCSFSDQPKAYLPFVAFLCLGYGGARLIQGGVRHAAPVFVVATVIFFIWIKRYSFLPDAVLLPPGYLTIGISYVFFRIMSLLIDARAGTVAGRIDLVSYLNYALNFTSLVSGPIQRFQEYHRMEADPRPPVDAVAIGAAAERMVIGCFKVFILSGVVISLQRHRIDALAVDSSFVARLGDGVAIATLYPLYLFLNFSGYTDFVIGVARLFGIILPENFDRPFSSESFIEFWSRWHISLSTWLKTYVYTPLVIALMRRFPSPRIEPLLGVLSYFVTFFLVGVWHGQTSEFVFFGLLQGGGVAINKLYQIACETAAGPKAYRRWRADPLYRGLACGLTFTWFAFSLLWFWSSWPQIATMASRIGGPGLIVLWLGVIVAAGSAIKAGQAARRWAYSVGIAGAPVLSSRYLRTVTASVMVVMLVLVSVALNAPAPEIVYKAF